MGWLGFKSSRDAVEDAIAMAEADVEFLRKAVAELQRVEREQQQQPHDVELNIRLPNGAALRAAFAGGEMLAAVQSYVQQSVKGAITLATTHPVQKFKNLEITLFAAGLAPRAALIATLEPTDAAPDPDREHSPRLDGYRCDGGGAAAGHGAARRRA